MAKLNSYLTEAKTKGAEEGTRISFDDPETFVKKIKKECSQIIAIYKKHSGKVLYRGIKSYPSDYTYIIPRTNRTPMDTPSEIQEQIDRGFYHVFGWKPRSEGVFCVADIGTARNYSSGRRASVIFPKNGFKYVWSPEILDLYFSRVKDMNDYDEVDIDQMKTDYYDKYVWYMKNGKWEQDAIFYTKGKDKEVDKIIYDFKSEYWDVEDIEDIKKFNNLAIINIENPIYIEKTTANVSFRINGMRVDVTYDWKPEQTFDDFREENEDRYTMGSEGDQIDQWIQDYQDDNIDDVLSDSQYKEHEVMIKCQGYYAVTEDAPEVFSLIFGKEFHLKI